MGVYDVSLVLYGRMRGVKTGGRAYASGHGCNEDDGSGGVWGGEHVLADGLGDEEGADGVDVDEALPFCSVVRFSGEVGAVRRDLSVHVTSVT